MKQFLLFLLTGGIAAAINFSSRFLYNKWMNFSLAIILAYLTGMITAFILAKLIVFQKSQQPLHRSAWRFSLINAIAIAQTWSISMLLAYILPLEVAHAIGITVPVITSYIGHKRWSFR